MKWQGLIPVRPIRVSGHMAAKAVWIALAVVAAIGVAGAAATVYYMGQPGKSPAGGNAPGTNRTEGNNTTCSEQLATDGGGSMTMSIPIVGTSFVSTDVKDHYTMPAGIKKVTVNISWDKTGWDLNLAIGTGDCPDNGVVKASSNNVQGGPLTLEFKATGDALEEGQWFVHAACNDPNSHRGGSVTFTYTVTTHTCSE
jgi:hypothetical protein